MVDQLRREIERFLSQGRFGVLSAADSGGVQSIMVHYRARGITLECLLPRWSDLAYLVEQDPRVALVVVVENPGGLAWLSYRGQATTVAEPDWEGLVPPLPNGLRPEDLFVMIRTSPGRIELMRGAERWPSRETLDF